MGSRTSVSVVEYSYSHSSSSATGLADFARGNEAALSGCVPGQPIGCLTVRTIFKLHELAPLCERLHGQSKEKCEAKVE